MLAGGLGGLRAARVDHDHASASGANAGEAPPHVGRAHQAAVRCQGVRAEDEEEVGAVDVGHRNQREVSEHAQRREHLRQLVGGAGRVDVPRPERARERQQVGHQTEVVRDRIAVVDADGVAAVPPPHTDESLGGAIQRLLPGRLAPARAVANQRRANAVRVVVQVGQRRRLGADVAAAERIVGVAPHRPDALSVDLDENAAQRLAKRAGRDAGGRVIAHVDNRHPERYRSRIEIPIFGTGGCACGAEGRIPVGGL